MYFVTIPYRQVHMKMPALYQSNRRLSHDYERTKLGALSSVPNCTLEISEYIKNKARPLVIKTKILMDSLDVVHLYTIISLS